MFIEYKTSPLAMGDFIVAYVNPFCMRMVQLSRTVNVDGKWGSIKAENVVGRRYGDKIQTDKGYFYALHPTAELWTTLLPVRTQILFTPDISMIIAELSLRPGMTVIESGTGSGSFTHALARAVRDNTNLERGRVLTFEFHEQRFKKAQEEFQEHGLTPTVQSAHRDVIANGFGIENVADAVFLDLPEPWSALDSAARAFKRGKVGRICTFSPCIEQVQATITALHARGFTDVKTVELLVREHQMRKTSVPSFEDALALHPQGIVPWSKRAARKRSHENKLARKKARTNDAEDDRIDLEDSKIEEDVMEDPSKNNEEDVMEDSSKNNEEDVMEDSLKEMEESKSNDIGDVSLNLPLNSQKPTSTMQQHTFTTNPLIMRGHTSYLTFATYLPEDFSSTSI